ncbi:MAG: hypothetical protein NWE76_07545, partial [Candidatus Bathyarchaeota archaeon]|nr:hypothetical protein [Candidatus Bathyarchaeota archaeon]
RLEQIATATKIPTRQLLRRLGSNLVRQSNAFLIKVRDVDKSGGQIRRVPGSKKVLKPVAGYFIPPPETMQFESANDRLLSWRQRMPDGNKVPYKLDNVVHIYHDRKEGFVFGTPITAPVMDDIRALRKIEENIEMLVYQHLFPLFQYKVGTKEEPAGIDEDGRLEVDVVRSEIRYMPSEGGIVTPHRHEIQVVGAEGNALRADGYLEHFKKRVFSGMGVSAVDMGEGETANRATADNMSRNLIDSVKDYQQVMESFINEFVIKELLLESTFGPEVLDEEMRCWMKFKEIDIDAQIKKEAHAADQFAKDVVNWSEARIMIGKEPIKVPTPDEVDSGKDLSDKYPEWYDTRWKLFQEPTLLIQALDEAYSPLAKSVARNNSLETTSGDIEEAGEEKKKQEVELEKERGKAKVAVAKAMPRVGTTRTSKPKKKDGYLRQVFLSVKEDVVQRTILDPVLDTQWLGQLIRSQMSTTVDQLIAEQMLAFRNGYSNHGYAGDPVFAEKAALARGMFRDRAEHYITKLTNQLVSRLDKEIRGAEGPLAAQQARAAFDALEYRTSFIEDVEIRKANFLGRAIGMRDIGGVQKIQSYTEELFACDRCKGENLNEVELNTVTLDQLPPYHANCHCNITSVNVQKSVTDAKIDEPPEEVVASGDVADCPKCGKTCIRKTDTPDVYNCRNCRYSFRNNVPVEDEKEEPEVEEEDSKESDFARCKIRVAALLRREHPEWAEGQVKAMAEAACEHIRAKGE